MDYCVIKTSRWDSNDNVVNGPFSTVSDASKYMLQWILADIKEDYGEDWEDAASDLYDEDYEEYYLPDNMSHDTEGSYYAVSYLIKPVKEWNNE